MTSDVKKKPKSKKNRAKQEKKHGKRLSQNRLDRTNADPAETDGAESKTFAMMADRLGITKHHRSWAEWSKYLQQRKKPTSISDLFSTTEPWLWGADSELVRSLSEVRDLIGRKSKKNQLRSANQLMQLIDQHNLSGETQLHPQILISAILFVVASPSLAGHQSEDDWSKTINQIVDIIESVNQNNQPELQNDPFVHQLLTVELPLTLARQFPEAKSIAGNVTKAIQQFEYGLSELLDGDGWIDAKYMSQLRPLLGCWTRSRTIMKSIGPMFSKEHYQHLYEWMVRQSLRLVRRNHSQMLLPADMFPCDDGLLEKAVRLSTESQDRKIAKQLFSSGKTVSTKPPKIASKNLSSHSEWAGMAVLQNEWSRDSDKIAVVFDQSNFHVDIYHRRSLVSGKCLPKLVCDGRPAKVIRDWEVTCWHNDDDVQFLELETELDFGLTLGRQFLLARDDRFLLMADVILGLDGRQLDYSLSLPLGDGIQAEPEEESREVYLKAKQKIKSLVLPLALPEWNVARSEGSLTINNGDLRLQQMTEGNAMYAPVLFDLDPKRSVQPRTWRQLTVAEHLQIQPNDVAVGFRAKIGKNQWMIYRSLAEKGNRTLLGENLYCEFFVGRMNKIGETDELLSIE